MSAIPQLFRFLTRRQSRFPEAPTWPPDEGLPPNWQDWTGGAFPLEAHVIWTAPIELRTLQVVYQRQSNTANMPDVAVTTHHFLNLTGGDPDNTWTDPDFETVEDSFDDFWAAIASYYQDVTLVSEYRWYKSGSAFSPTPAGGNAVVRVVARGLAGSAASLNQLPPQVAISVTERTALRKHWGRFYLPAPGTNALTIHGNINDTFCGVVADAAEDWYNTCRAGDIVPVVFSRTLESAFEVEKLQVDSTFDVIRSRRWKYPVSRIVRQIT